VVAVALVAAAEVPAVEAEAGVAAAVAVAGKRYESDCEITGARL
jgi:hypothetical protein